MYHLQNYQQQSSSEKWDIFHNGMTNSCISKLVCRDVRYSASACRAALWCPFLCSTKTLSITSSRGGERKSANITGRIVAMGTGDGRWEDHASCQKRRAVLPQFCTTQTIKTTWGRPRESIRELLTISKLEMYTAQRNKPNKRFGRRWQLTYRAV